MNYSKWIIAILLILIGILGGYVTFMSLEKKSLVVTPIPTGNDRTETREYHDRIHITDLSFSYPNGWHLFSTRDFENPNRIKPDIRIYLNENPIEVTSPSGGPMPRANIIISSLDEDEAILSLAENLPSWQTITKDTIIIDGKTVERSLITTDMRSDNISYEYPFWEIVYVNGQDLNFRLEHIYNDASEADEPAWVLLKETFNIK